MRIVRIPASLDYRSLDQLVGALDGSREQRSLFDARHLRWVDPHGMTGLLATGTVARDRQGSMSRLELPESGEVMGYLSRMGFFEAAESVFQVEAQLPRRSRRASDVLLEITPITTNSDVHAIVDRVQTRAGAILSKTLDYPPSAVVQFSVILSEVCQNIIEHAEAPGWVAAQAYHWRQRLGRMVLVISVADLGRGFRGSLADEHSTRFGDRWGDATALEAAFMHGLTRFPDSGRGQGIQQIRKQVRRWKGRFSIRSGTARIQDVPEWDDSPPLEEALPELTGAQIHIILPARVEGGEA